MGDRAVRWATQQEQFDAVAQIILVKICKHLDDRRPIWSWSKKIDVIATEIKRSVATVQRYLLELEGTDRDGNPTGVRPVLFRGYRWKDGLPTEYIMLGPNKTTTDTYIAAKYPSNEDETLPQLAVGYPPATCSEKQATLPQLAVPLPQLAGTYREVLSSSPLLDGSNPKQERPPSELVEIWKSAFAKIEIRVGRQRCFTWYSAAHPVDFKNGVLLLSVPNAHFSDELSKSAARKLILECVQSAGLPVREVTFVAGDARQKPLAKAARAP